MRLVEGIDELPVGGPAVVTVGFFDGVHRGHRAVLERAATAARDRGIRSLAVTFDRHPREIIAPGSEPRLLTTVERRASLIAETGIDVIVVLAFTEEFSRWPAEQFAAAVLADGLGAELVIVGSNFTFGHRALGTVATLHALGPELGFLTEGVGLMDVGERRISSSSIREALAAGDLDWPREALGRRFVLDGQVTSGAGRGKGLGYPTANLATWPRLLLPGSGIYAGIAEYGSERSVTAISVGTNPTFGSEPLHAEAYLLDYEGGERRGQPLSIEFWARLRDEKRFASAEALTEAIAEDVVRTREIVRIEP